MSRCGECRLGCNEKGALYCEENLGYEQCIERLHEALYDKRIVGSLTDRPTNEWIPCSERLPAVRQYVLCQCRAGIMEVLRLTESGDWEHPYPRTVYLGGFVIAWMPLPNLYRGEDNGTR